ncbi:acetoacetate--CoA ligase [Prosthecodimorpha staleyi]|uniref:Acetoacetate--CoA ligase n=1 Tax=Prosthecodimorpha staleyi TaxID=2840188 RepID=A0A947GE20_9HYPH|nr:acetoacetate--CoA ligase [Prosthecodimorpha staleyi]MBT9293223.1 acetoacetate--CoA ligase [Prosthecodimorpha staleyi]
MTALESAATHEPRPLWMPDPAEVAASAFAAFAAEAGRRAGTTFADFDALHAWSIADREAFWDLVWDFGGVIGEKGERRLVDGDRMPGAQFFPDARLNFAENLLRRSDDTTAIVYRAEDRREGRMSWRELNALVSRLQQALEAEGVAVGDRVCAMLPNGPEAVASMLAVASLGAVWSSCSPDFGERGVLDRFGQIEPKVFITCDGYWYGGKTIDVADKVAAVAGQLPTAGKVVIVAHLGTADALAARLPNGVTFAAFTAGFDAKPPRFVRVAFNQPLYILFSSGTTGVPKCIVHGVGGTLLQHLKEHKLHAGVKPGDRVFYFTTLGWMMWNWLVSALAAEATLILFDGSPFAPTPLVLWDMAAAERVTLFGTSAKYIDSIAKEGLRPRDTHDLSALRMICSTGSPLAPESFGYVYEAIKPTVHLASISGGTDIVSCFVLGIPDKPVWKGEIQGPGLGLAVDVYDDAGRPVRGEKGELVCAKAFPCMPVMFWNDPGGAKYRAAYFERFPNVWCHGDFAEWTEHGGMIIHGRSDATLNPGGVRIGTAEIYAQVEQIPEVIEALAIGQDWDGDVRIVLFVRLKAGATLDEALTGRIKAKIRTGASPRHVPARIVAVADIPRTKSGKIVELAVREVVHGRPVKNVEALANPDALALFAGIEDLAR